MSEDKKELKIEDEILTANEQQLLGALGLVDEEPVVGEDYVATSGIKMQSTETKASMEAIIEALKTVCDPEIMINIYDMGLIYNIDQKEDGDIFIDMTVTSPMCPVAGILPQQAADAVSLVDGTGIIEVKIVWEPAWTFERMSDDAREMIELF